MVDRYEEEMPGVIREVIRTPQNIDTTYKITLDHNPVDEELEVYVYCLRSRPDDDTYAGNLDVVMGTPILSGIYMLVYIYTSI